MSQVQRATNQRGVPMEYPIAKERMRLVLRAVNESEFRQLYPITNTLGLARHFDVSPHDMGGVIEYYEMPPRPATPRTMTAERVDLLAERLWMLIEPRIDAKIAAALKGVEPSINGVSAPQWAPLTAD